jgi:hypothetical protein
MPTTATSIQKQLLDALASRIKAVELGGMPDAQIYVRKTPTTPGITFPAVFLIPVQEQLRVATNASDDHGYGVQLTLARAGNRDQTANDDWLYERRQILVDEFNNRRLQSMPGVHTTVELGPVLDLGSLDGMYDSTSLVVRCWLRRRRGSHLK